MNTPKPGTITKVRGAKYSLPVQQSENNVQENQLQYVI